MKGQGNKIVEKQNKHGSEEMREAQRIGGKEERGCTGNFGISEIGQFWGMTDSRMYVATGVSFYSEISD